MLLQRRPTDGPDPGTRSEAWLQKLLFDHPSCLPIEEIEPGLGSPIVASMEVPTPHGPIDLLFLSAEGDIFLVEVKLWRNPQARREVVAQALDYAACLFEMDFEAFQRAFLRGQPSRGQRSLVEMFPDAERPDEATFVDAVSTNLSRGRIVVLVVGDGIRSETERLADALQSHVGFHFTFALVELQVFQMPEQGEWIVYPRTLAKTCMINRGVVSIDDRRTIVVPATIDPSPQPAETMTITAERFWEAMAKRGPDVPARLRGFLARLEELGVRPEFRKTMILRWTPAEGKPTNLGYIKTDGQIWTDAANWSAPHELSHAYIEELAQAFDGRVERDILGARGNWHVRIGDKVPKIEAVLDKFDGWYDAIARFIECLQQRYEGIK